MKNIPIYNEAEVDQLTTHLIGEFEQHLQQCLSREPAADPRLVFEGWIIQRIAGIHYILGERPDPIQSSDHTRQQLAL